LGNVYMALEPRFKASVLLSGGFDYLEVAGEVDPFNFAPRVRTPTLMVNGREDFRFPLEVSQEPMFRSLGVAEEDKRHALIEGGHIPPRIEVIRETLDWLDKYLGPVETR
jgi:pimeloyl-ACP methyl ester carboxylesterase